MSHEMISPLNLINMYVELLANTPQIKQIAAASPKKKKGKVSLSTSKLDAHLILN